MSLAIGSFVDIFGSLDIRDKVLGKSNVSLIASRVLYKRDLTVIIYEIKA